MIVSLLLSVFYPGRAVGLRYIHSMQNSFGHTIEAAFHLLS